VATAAQDRLTMKKLLLTGVAALLLTGAAHADSASNFTQKLIEVLSRGTILKCGDMEITAQDGKLHTDGPNGVFGPFNVRGDKIYLNEKPYELLEYKCSRSTTC